VADIDIVCGRYGACYGRCRWWPIWLWLMWFVAEIVISRFCVLFSDLELKLFSSHNIVLYLQ